MQQSFSAPILTSTKKITSIRNSHVTSSHTRTQSGFFLTGVSPSNNSTTLFGSSQTATFKGPVRIKFDHVPLSTLRQRVEKDLILPNISPRSPEDLKDKQIGMLTKAIKKQQNDLRTSVLYDHDKIIEILNNSKKILDSFGIRYKIIHEMIYHDVQFQRNQHDYATQPAVKHLAFFLQDIVNELSIFPYSFIKKLNLSLTICSSLDMLNESCSQLSMSKRLSFEIFSMDRLKDTVAIQNHVHKIILMNYINMNRGLLEEWARLLKAQRQVNTKKCVLEDMIRTFKGILNSKKGLMQLSPVVDPDTVVKANLLRSKLQEFDPFGLVETWFVVKNPKKKRKLSIDLEQLLRA